MSVRILLLLLVAATGLRAQYNYYLPQFTDGVSSNGTFRTTLAVVNNSKTAANLTITASRDDSTSATLSIPGLGTSGKLTAKLPPGATSLYTTDGSGDGSLSAAQVGSDIAVSIVGIVSNLDLSGNVLSETYAPAVSGEELAAEYLLPVDTTGPLNTAVSLYNPAATALTVTLTLVDASGKPAGSVTVPLGPGNHATRFVKGDLFAGIGDFQGSLDVTASPGKVVVGGLRQRAGAASFALLPAVSRLSHQVRFLFPQVFDGPAPEGTLQTTFALTNLSLTKPATPALSLTLDDGTPMVVNLPGLTAGQAIPPGGTIFWQTDGLSATLVSGAASLQSDQPLAVVAVLTTTDPNGVVLSESGFGPSTPNYQFRLPFDQAASGMTAEASFLNTGRRPITLTLTLLDPTGAPLATLQSGSIPGHGRLTGAIQDLFSGTAITAGSLVVSTGTPVDLSLAAFSVRHGAMVRSVTPGLRIPVSPAGTPSTVTPTLNSTRTASADIATSGGTLTVTDDLSNKFTLTLPPGALLDRQTIKMTAIKSATGVSKPGLVAGVQLEPDGLGLMQPATLKIELAAPLPAGAYPIGWRGASPGVYLNPPLKDTKSLTLVLTHFSGAGAGGFDLTSELISIANQLDLVNSAAAYWANQGRQDALSGNDADAAIDGEKLLETLDISLDTVLVPMMELAMASDDLDVLRCAVTQAIAATRQLVLLGAPDDDPHLVAAQEFMSYAFQRMAAKIKARCDRHDFTAFYDAMGALRQGELLGSPVDIDPGSCPPVLELDYTSEMKGTIPVGLTGSFDAKISGKITLTGSFTKDMLTQVQDPAKDLFTSFKLSGSAPETYDSIDFVVNNVPPGCSETISGRTPDQMTVKTGADPQLSQVQFKFDPHYDPQAVTANGQQLCSFCAVYQKVPVKVGIWMDPGKPSETLLSTCDGVSYPVTLYSWWTGWVVNHASSGDNGYIESWDLVNTPAVFAQKTINRTVVGDGGITITEITDLKLKPVPVQ